MIRELDTAVGVLGWSEKQNEIYIEYYRGTDLIVEIPKRIEGMPVTVVGKKAFLGARFLREVSLPFGIRQIGDYGFASCHKLETVRMWAGDMEFGQGVFYHCDKLERILTERFMPSNVTEDRTTSLQKTEDISCLLAATVGILNASFLLLPKQAGEPDWIERLDHLILNRLAVPDEEGFANMLMCGEEDYVGNDSNYEHYCSGRRKEKIRLLLLRMLHSWGIASDTAMVMKQYLLDHACGREQDETWKVVLEEHGDEKLYYDLLFELGGIDKDNIDLMISDLGEAHAEMKAYLLRLRNERFSGGDFFDDLDL